MEKSLNKLISEYSLPNKLFDYIQAQLPVLATNLPEVKKVVEKYDIGLITSSFDSKDISEKMIEIISNENRLGRWKKNLNLAAAELCWEKEQFKFLELFLDGGKT